MMKVGRAVTTTNEVEVSVMMELFKYKLKDARGKKRRR